VATLATHAAARRSIWPPALAPAGWRYDEPGSRDGRLDLLRGCLVVAMLVDHLGGHSWLYFVTGGNQFFVSAAEGFVFLSGLVMGLVYARLIEREGLWSATRRALRRAAVLYLAAIALAVGFRAVSALAGASWAEPFAGVGDLMAYTLAIATLRTGIYLADVLMLYALLVLAAPAAFALLARGRADVLIGVSIGLWGLHQFGLTGPIDAVTEGLIWFPPIAWQLVFVAGLVAGYHWRALRARLAGRTWRPALVGLALTAAGLIALAAWAPASPLAEPVAAFFGKEELRVGRLLAAAVFFPLLFGLASVTWRPLRAGLGWLLIPLGQRALLAYSLHLALALASHVWWPLIPGYDMDSAPVNTLAQLGAVVVLWTLVLWLPRIGQLAATAVGRLAAPAAPSARRLGGAATLGCVALLVGLTAALASPRLPATPRLGFANVTAGSSPADVQVGAAGVAAPAAVPAGPTPIVRKVAPAGPTPIARRAAPAGPTPIAARRAVKAPALGEITAAAPAVQRPPSAAPADSPSEANILQTGLASSAGVGASPASADAGPSLRRARPTTPGRVEEHAFHSESLGREMPYIIYLPADYERDDARYPVLYLLHGLGADRNEWVEYGLLHRADSLIAVGELPPMVIVLPEGEQSYWVNHVDGAPWGDYVAIDLARHVDATYRTRPKPAQRAIGGLSMGAHGALTLSMTFPDRFGVVGAHSPSIRPVAQTLPQFGTGEAFDERDPIALIEAGRMPPGVRLWLDAGDEDWWLPSVFRLREALATRNVPFTWRAWPGTHDSPYWAEHVDDYLRFYGEAFAELSDR
jgi:enterochelin esterase-like enzyme